MSVHVLDAMAREGFEELVAFQDEAAGLRAFLGIHDTSRGPAFGGIRRFAYRDEKTALLDCLRLSKAMSLKCALAGVPGGGAKLVLFDHPGLDVEAAYGHLGDCIERQAGRYYAGPDVGTGWKELASVAERTSYVTRPGDEGPGDLPRATAAGVFAGMRAALEALDGEAGWERRTVVLQGLGNVGMRLARRLIDLGVRVIASEIDAGARERARELTGLELVEEGRELGLDCDVFAPCAMGGVLHDLTIQRLRARVVCGAANNPLAKNHHATLMHERGILYVPDIVVTSGAVLRGAEFHLVGRALPFEEIELRIGRVAERVLARAQEENAPPFSIARREGERVLREARRARRQAHDELVTAPASGSSENRAAAPPEIETT